MDYRVSRIVSVVTVYHPKKNHAENIQKISGQSDVTIVCDNSEYDNEELFADIPGLKYCPNYDNLGLSAAFNKVLCDTNGFTWMNEDYIVFFDQDSIIEEGHLRALVGSFEELERNGYKVGCLGPAFYNNSNQRYEKPHLYRQLTETAIGLDSIMTSSMMCRYGVLKEVGYWNEEIFLDMADWDICWRIRKRNYICAMTFGTVLNHTIGEGEKKIGPIRLRIAKPFREYYETRDCLYLLKKDYVPIKAKIRFFLMLTVRPFLHLMFLEDKKERKYYIKLGVEHYRKRITGKLKEKDRWRTQHHA